MSDTQTTETTSTPTPPPTEGEQAQVQTQAPAKTKVKAQKTGNFIIDTAGVVENLTKAKALNMADALVQDIDNNSFVLGGVLQVIFDQGWFEGYPSFGEFVYEKYGFQERKARYLMEIYTHLTKKNIPWDKVSVLGWTKLKDLARYLTPENVDEWVEKAKNLTVAQLQAALKAQTPEGEQPTKTTSDTSTIKYKVKNDQLDTVNAAIAKAKAEIPTEYDNVALEGICAAYLGGQVAVQSAPQKDLKVLMQEAGWQAVLGIFDGLFPNVDLDVKVKGEAEAAQA